MTYFAECPSIWILLPHSQTVIMSDGPNAMEMKCSSCHMMSSVFAVNMTDHRCSSWSLGQSHAGQVYTVKLLFLPFFIICRSKSVSATHPEGKEWPCWLLKVVSLFPPRLFYSTRWSFPFHAKVNGKSGLFSSSFSSVKILGDQLTDLQSVKISRNIQTQANSLLIIAKEYSRKVQNKYAEMF